MILLYVLKADGGSSNCVKEDCTGNTIAVSLDTKEKDGPSRSELFQLDHVFGPTCSQEDIFLPLRPRVDEFMNGYNNTCLSYGQTG